MALHHEAARIITLATEKKGSLKPLVQKSKCENKKALYALVCESLRYDDVLSSVVRSSKITSHERQLQGKSPYLVKVLLYDFLFGKGLRAAPKPLQKAILNHKTSLRAELARLKVKAGASSNEDLLPESAKKQVCLPRYVRVNLVKTTVDGVIEHFTTRGFSLVTLDDVTYTRYIDAVRNLKPKQFVHDPHLHDLLTFAAGTDLHDDALYTSGHIILQDKASCIPACVLQPPPGAHVIDCCAAPGNKTTHAAALMANQGKIFSFDKDPHRLQTMNKLIQRAGVTCVETRNQDFLCVDPNDPRYARVQYIIVDPSCSGSGIVSRLGALTDDKESVSSERLKSLAEFQRSILQHALSFPAAQRVVYSTCSIHQEENENVVKLALESLPAFTLSAAVPEIPSRGLDVFPTADKCLRLCPSSDCTNGFFVACFERTGSCLNLPGGVSKAENLTKRMDITRPTAASDTSDLPSNGVSGKEHSRPLPDLVKVKKHKRKKKKKTATSSTDTIVTSELNVHPSTNHLSSGLDEQKTSSEVTVLDNANHQGELMSDKIKAEKKHTTEVTARNSKSNGISSSSKSKKAKKKKLRKIRKAVTS